MKLARKDYLGCAAGVAAMEFALVLPILLTIFFAAIEISRYSIINQKIDKAVANMADLIAREKTIDINKLNGVVNAGREIIRPFDFIANGAVVYSSVDYSLDMKGACEGVQQPCVSWQYAPGTTVHSLTSRIGGAGQSPDMPNGYVLSISEHLIVTELSYNYTPILEASSRILPVLEPRTLYKVAVFSPRAADADLSDLNTEATPD